jgi:NAD-dependent DNA ligase
MNPNVKSEILKNTDYSKYSLKDLEQVIKDADNAYYNSDEPLMNDAKYDALREYVQTAEPTFAKIGSLPNAKNKVLLPVWMGSMDKRKSNISEKAELVISDKLDGVSCLYMRKDGASKMFSRGNGEYGTDITSLIEFVNIPNIGYKKDFMIRGELIMQNKTFLKLQNESDKPLSNARNTVSGIVNSKTPDTKFRKLVDCVFYEVIEPKNLKPSEQFTFMKNELQIGDAFIVPYYITTGTKDSELRESLTKRKTKSCYEIDGLIVAKNTKYDHANGKNPKHAFAFKELSDNMLSKITEVTRVDWNASKDLFLKPTVHFKEVLINNVKIKQATGFNAKYISDNKIGKGTMIEIVRSGDVIPYINKIHEGTKADMPEQKFAWTKSGVDIFIDDDNSDLYNEKQFIYATTMLKIDNLGPKNIKKLYDGGITTLKQLFNVTSEKLITSKVFQKKTAENIVSGISKRKESLSCLDLMAVSNVFGRGLGAKTLELIITNYPVNLNTDQDTLPSVSELMKINGIGKLTAEQYLRRLKDFKEFVKHNSLSWCDDNAKTAKPSTKSTTSEVETNSAESKKPLKGQKVLFTGFRSPELQKIVRKNGGVMYDSFKKDITLLVFKTRNKKVDSAESAGIKTEQYDDFKKRMSNLTPSTNKDATSPVVPKKDTVKPTSPATKPSTLNDDKPASTSKPRTSPATKPSTLNDDKPASKPRTSPASKPSVLNDDKPASPTTKGSSPTVTLPKRGRPVKECKDLAKSTCMGRTKHISKPCTFTKEGECINKI